MIWTFQNHFGPIEGQGIKDKNLDTSPRLSEISEKNWSTFDIPFIIQSHAESIKEILAAL